MSLKGLVPCNLYHAGSSSRKKTGNYFQKVIEGFFAYIENIREEKCCPTKENLPQIPVIFLEFAVINIGKKYLWIIFIFYSLPALVSK